MATSQLSFTVGAVVSVLPEESTGADTGAAVPSFVTHELAAFFLVPFPFRLTNGSNATELLGGTVEVGSTGAMTGGVAETGVVVGTVNDDELASLPGVEVDGGGAALADGLEGMAAGTPTAMTAAAATVPASMALDRPSGSGASPSSH